MRAARTSRLSAGEPGTSATARRVPRIGAALAAAAGAALALPAPALAHVTPGVDYRFPLPVWLYALAGGAAVVASAPAAALAVTSGRSRTSGDLYRYLRPLRLGAIGLALATALVALVVAGGLLGENMFFENAATILVWVDFWVGLGIVSTLVGNVWDFVSPLSAAGRVVERVLARRGVPTLAYPGALGVWPATVLVLAWSWAELVWSPAKEPRTLVAIIVCYVAFQLVAMAVFGTEVWLERGELFTVVARTLARFAPLELYVRAPERACRAGRCGGDEERRGCAACWLDADLRARGIRLRGYGAGVRREAALAAGGGAFVLALLATVVFDGFSQAERFNNLEAFFLERSTWLGYHVGVLRTAVMVAMTGGFALAFLAVCALVALREPGGVRAAARHYAPTLIPIAAVYFVSHYFLFLLYAGQLTPAVVLDPLEREWVPDYGIWTGVPGAAVWWVQVALIVAGHVIAVFEAHRVAVRVHRRRAMALAAQAPLLLLMVAYTFSGLWVLGQVLRAP